MGRASGAGRVNSVDGTEMSGSAWPGCARVHLCRSFTSPGVDLDQEARMTDNTLSPTEDTNSVVPTSLPQGHVKRDGSDASEQDAAEQTSPAEPTAEELVAGAEYDLTPGQCAGLSMFL